MNDEFPSLEEMRARGYDPVSLAKGKLIAMAHAEARDLIDLIKSAFQNVPRPAITLHVARGLDDEWHLSQERFAELRALDPEENWSELGPERTHFPSTSPSPTTRAGFSTFPHSCAMNWMAFPRTHVVTRPIGLASVRNTWVSSTKSKWPA